MRLRRRPGGRAVLLGGAPVRGVAARAPAPPWLRQPVLAELPQVRLEVVQCQVLGSPRRVRRVRRRRARPRAARPGDPHGVVRAVVVDGELPQERELGGIGAGIHDAMFFRGGARAIERRRALLLAPARLRRRGVELGDDVLLKRIQADAGAQQDLDAEARRVRRRDVEALVHTEHDVRQVIQVADVLQRLHAAA